MPRAVGSHLGAMLSATPVPPKVTSSPSTKVAKDKVKDWRAAPRFDPAYGSISAIRLFDQKNDRPPHPSRYERRLFPPEQSASKRASSRWQQISLGFIRTLPRNPWLRSPRRQPLQRSRSYNKH